VKPIDVRPAVRVRDQSIELLRIAAAFGIVLFHAGASGAAVGYAGIVIFILLSVAAEVGPNRDRRRSPVSLAAFFLIPWAVWWLVYGAINLVRGRALLPPGPTINAVLDGTAPHLWYLPFMCGVLLCVSAGKTLVSRPVLLVGSGLVAMGLFASAGSWLPWAMRMGAPWAQYSQALTAVFAGLCLGAAVQPRIKIGVAAILVIGVATTALPTDVAVGVLVGLVATTTLLVRPLPVRWNVEEISRCTYGVYLMHPLWLSVFAPALGGLPWLRVVAAFSASLAATWSLRRLAPSLARFVV
jgi:hypothetical protein